MPSNHLILCHPLLLPSIFSRISWPKCWSFSFSTCPSKEYSGLISSRIDWFALLAFQRTLRSLLQHHSSKASILLCFAFFTVQFSQPYLTAGKTIALTVWTFVSSVMSLLLNTLSRFAISFPAKKQLSSDFIAAVAIRSDFRAQEKKICHCFHLLPFYLPWSNGDRCHDLSSFNALSQLFHSSPLRSSRDYFIPLRSLPLEWYHLHIWGCLCFSHLSWFQIVTHPVQYFS